jgi:hypothetical protein
MLPQAEFSKFVRFEDGAVVAPEDVEIFERSGDLVGALSFHPPNGDVRFPLEETYYWFSLSGPCPNMKNGAVPTAASIKKAWFQPRRANMWPEVCATRSCFQATYQMGLQVVVTTSKTTPKT